MKLKKLGNLEIKEDKMKKTSFVIEKTRIFLYSSFLVGPLALHFQDDL
jgi:hypothetical protein